MSKHTYDSATLLCPHCHTYLLDKQLGALAYKSCNSCGYAREVANRLELMTVATAGNGISPIKHTPELLRPEERRERGEA